jgi:hypothetical protein
MFCAAEFRLGLRAVVLFSHGKESDHENETVCPAGGVSVLPLGPGGHERGVLHEGSEVLPGKLLRRELLCRQRQLLPGKLLQVTDNRKPVAGSQ